MSARDDGITGEVMTEEVPPPAGTVHCDGCDRPLTNEMVWVDEHMGLTCIGCAHVMGLIEHE